MTLLFTMDCSALAATISYAADITAAAPIISAAAEQKKDDYDNPDAVTSAKKTIVTTHRKFTS